MGVIVSEARIRIEEIRSFYRRLMHVQCIDGSWDWWLRNEIDELEVEIVRENIKKLTAMHGSQFSQEDIIHHSLYRPEATFTSTVSLMT